MINPRAARIFFGLSIIGSSLVGGALIVGLIIGFPVFIWGLLTKKEGK